MICAGCASGTHTLRVRTEPEGARLYHKGKLLGVTPVSVPQRWYMIGNYWESSVPVRIEKEGFRTLETHLHHRMGARNGTPNWKKGSEFGRGNTYFLFLKLERADK